MKAIGYNSKGERKEFEVENNGILYCVHKDLVSLKLPEGVRKLYCIENKLKKLNLPNSIEEISCDRNVLGLDKVDWKCEIELY